MEPSRFSTPSGVRSPWHWGMMAVSFVSSFALPLKDLVIAFVFMVFPPPGRASSGTRRRGVPGVTPDW